MFLELPASIHQHCEKLLDANIHAVRLVVGGDINQARLLETSKGNFFIKMNDRPGAAHLFETEIKGLELLSNADAIRTPIVIAFGNTPDGAFLLLEYIPSGERTAAFWQNFGRSLAALHRKTAPLFGLEHDNFIGSLPQSNKRHDTWAAFFMQERLQPQIDLAAQSNRLQNADFQQFETLFKKLPDLCPAEPPALVHGDFWSGNFLVAANGQPVLVDPAAAYAHREMDLAMSRLFGGFDRQFYRSYEEAFPLAPGFEFRLPVYQLYYLMVHVNLFGGSYVGSVRGILQQFV